MELIDSHCHLHLMDLDAMGITVDALVNDAKANGVARLLCVATRLEQLETLKDYAKIYPEVSISLGLHPNEVDQQIDIDWMVKQFQEIPQLVAVGETGLDFYRHTVAIETQREQFKRQIQVAKAVKKPLIIHSRDAKAELVDILKAENAAEVGGVIHCFTEDWAMAKACLNLNFLISFSGIITFKNATALQEVVKEVPLDRLLIETDSPYLAPHPYRGKVNQPRYVKHVAEKVAELKSISIEKVAEQTTKNYRSCFGE